MDVTEVVELHPVKTEFRTSRTVPGRVAFDSLVLDLLYSNMTRSAPPLLAYTFLKSAPSI